MNTLHSALTQHLQKPLPTAQQFLPALLDAEAAACLLGVSLRKFHTMRCDLPAPVRLGVRVVRWKTADLFLYIENLCADATTTEPPQLRAGKEAKKGLKVGLIHSPNVAVSDCEVDQELPIKTVENQQVTRVHGLGKDSEGSLFELARRNCHDL
jgi:hypothetical protein